MAANTTKLKQFPKKKQPIKLKNILAQPYTHYWPEINLEEIGELQGILQKAKSNCNDNIIWKKGFKIGLRSCFRALSRKEITFLLLSTEIKPRFIVSQILNFAHNNKDNTPILCVPNLSQLTEEIFGVNSLALANRQHMNSTISEWVTSKFYIYKRPEDISENIVNKEQVMNIKSKNKPYKMEPFDTSSLYLIKTGNERAFIPKGSKRTNMLEEVHGFSGDYITLSSPKNQTLDHILINEEADDDHEKNKLLSGIKQRIAKLKTQAPKSDLEIVDVTKIKDTGSEKSVINSQKYISMSVHKIQPQANKKEKRKKKQKKNKTS